MTEVNFRTLSDEQLAKIIAFSDDAVRVERARNERERRSDLKKFVRSFLFPNLWAILGIALSAYTIFWR